MAAFLLVTFYVATAGASLVVEGLFGVLGLIPREHQARVVEATVTWNYTTSVRSEQLSPFAENTRFSVRQILVDAL